MPDKTAGYIEMLKLATSWAKAAGLPEAVALRRLCEWAVVGKFPEDAFIDCVGNELSPLGLLKAFRAANGQFDTLTFGPRADPKDPDRAWERLGDVFVAKTGVLQFSANMRILPPPLVHRGIRRIWGRWRGKPVGLPACMGVDQEAVRQQSRWRITRCLDELAAILEIHQKRYGTRASGDQTRIEGDFKALGPEWAEWRRAADQAISDAEDAQEFTAQLDELDRRWRRFVDAHAKSPADSAWATRATEARDDWHLMLWKAHSVTDEEFEREFFPHEPLLGDSPGPTSTKDTEIEEKSELAVDAETGIKRRRGRPKGSGSYATVDEPLLEEMHLAMREHPGLSPTAAAKQVADRALGGGTPESKAQRLTDRYIDKYGR